MAVLGVLPENTSFAPILGNKRSSRVPNAQDNEFSKFQQTILNNLGYFGVSTNRIFGSNPNFFYETNTFWGDAWYYMINFNAVLKGIFILLVMLGYFGHITYLDMIGASDYGLCFILISITALIWYRRYPICELLKEIWLCLNSIHEKCGHPQEMTQRVKRRQKFIVISQSTLMWIGPFCLMVQYYADPKYCTFTYSILELDTPLLRAIFAAHEFIFLKSAWDTYGSCLALCNFEGIAFSTIIDKLNESLKLLYEDNDMIRARFRMKAPLSRTKISVLRRERVDPSKIAPGTSYNIDQLLMEYRHLTILCSQFNDWVGNKMFYMHMGAFFQYLSDVFAGMHVIKLPGAILEDIWFYMEDSFVAVYLLLQTYMFMSLVSKSSKKFLISLKDYMSFPNQRQKELRRVAKTLKSLSLKLGPCSVTETSVLIALDTIGSYYVCAALW